MLNNQNILLIVGFLIIMYLLFGNNNEKFEEQHCIKTPGTLCELGNRPHRCGPNCCKCKCNSESCKKN